MNRRLGITLVAALAIGACSDQQEPTLTEAVETPSLASAKKSARRSYVVRLSETAPADVQAQIERAGGRLRNISREAGVASFESDAADFATKVRALPGVEGAGLDRTIQWLDPNQRFVMADHHGGPAVGTTERWFPIQWNMQAISAPKAWKKGELGRGARVAILDGGIWDQHVDIAPNLDVARSRSFACLPNPAPAPCTPTPFNSDVGTFWHGTHVAGIVAAADNADNLGTIGVAPRATLIGVKVLHNGSGDFGWLIDAIVYASTPIRKGGAGADIINMSLGATFVPEPGDEELIRALDKATKYAHKQGTLLVASSGNGDAAGNGINHDDHPELVTLPAQSKHVRAVSSLAPLGYALGATNFDRLSSFSNIGKSIVDLSGPGGDFMLPGEDLCTLAIDPGPPPTTTTVTQPCWVFDMVVSSCRGTGVANVCWAAGTSMSSPAVAGVAALIVGKKGRMSPDRLFEELAKSSDDLGRRGFDAIYGKGRVNAARAVGASGRDRDRDRDDDDDDRRGDDDGRRGGIASR